MLQEVYWADTIVLFLFYNYLLFLMSIFHHNETSSLVGNLSLPWMGEG
jgi:hypothetical protein